MKLRIEGTEQEIKDWLNQMQGIIPLNTDRIMPCTDMLEAKGISKFYPNTRGNTSEGRVYVDLK